MTAKAHAVLCLSAITMFSRIAQQGCCMAYAFSISSACTRSRAYPSGEARGSSSPYFYLSSRRGHACGVDALSERKVSVRQCTSTLHGTIRSQEFLTSTKGATAKKFKSLVSKKRTRAEENATVVEGQRAVLDLLSDSTTRNLVKHIILEENAMPDQTMNAFINLVAACSTPPKVTFATSAVLKACSDTVTPQGVIALASLPAPYQYEYESCDSKVGTRTYLVLETSDPGNTGTLIRSAIACGVEAIILMPGSCDVWSPKTVRSAMTASFKIPLLQVGSWDECKERLKHFGVRLENDFYAATMEGSTVPNEGHDRGKGANHSLPYYKVDWAGSKSVVVCVGKEGPGLSQPIRRAIRDGEVRAVHVPMAEGIESLNAAVSGSVILFETARQRREKMNVRLVSDS